MRANPPEAFLYVYSCDLQSNVQIKVSEFEGIFRDESNPTRKLSQLFAEVAVYCNNRIVGSPVCTMFKKKPAEPPQLTRHKLIQSWIEWLTLPVRYCDLSRDAFLHLTVWEVDIEDAAAKTSSPRNQKKSSFQASNTPHAAVVLPKRLVAQSQLSLFSKRGVLRRGTIDVQMGISSTPDPFDRCRETWKYSDTWDKNVEILFKQVKRQSRGLVEDVPWLDPLTSRRIETIRATKKYSPMERYLFLVVELASVKLGTHIYEVVYYEDDSKNLRISESMGAAAGTSGRLCPSDPELGLESLAELKHSAMTRKNLRDGVGDRQLKPNKPAKDKLEMIIKLPSSQSLALLAHRDLVWKFRYYLKEDPRALNKFLRSVNWDRPQEVQSALTLMKDWAPIQPEDALELLSPAFPNPAVRSYAVSRLLGASPDQVLLYLPQLVQALKYEPQASCETSFLTHQLDGTTIGDQDPPAALSHDLYTVPADASRAHGDLASFLVDYALSSPRVSNFLYWYLKVEVEATKLTDPPISKMYDCLMERLFQEMVKRPDTRAQAEGLTAQMSFVEDLKILATQAKERGTRAEKEAALRFLLAEAKHMSELKGLILPLDPTVRLTTVVADKSAVFNSQLAPVKLTFRVVPSPPGKEKAFSENEYTILFKQGDDLRQDQLVIQMIRLMDTLFKKDQLDLKLTPYAVLSTGVNEGFVQFVKAEPLRAVVNKFGQSRAECIKDAMRERRPDQNGPFRIEANVVDNYVRSLAGYSVITYVLGIGDRHMDNLLLCEDGRLFHVDFGFILGRDPKPMPPPMKLTTEMVTAMGGPSSKQFLEFCQYCDSAYRILRRHANVLLNLFSLMLDAGIPDIASEADKAVSKLEQRLRLELSDEAASKHILSQIEASMSAKMPIISDMIHDIKQNFF